MKVTRQLTKFKMKTKVIPHTLAKDIIEGLKKHFESEGLVFTVGDKKEADNIIKMKIVGMSVSDDIPSDKVRKKMNDLKNTSEFISMIENGSK